MEPIFYRHTVTTKCFIFQLKIYRSYYIVILSTYHLFKSFTDGAKCNLNIKAEGTNEHHKIEGIFKAFAKAIKAAVKRDPEKMILPSTKGML